MDLYIIIITLFCGYIIGGLQMRSTLMKNFLKTLRDIRKRAIKKEQGLGIDRIISELTKIFF